MGIRGRYRTSQQETVIKCLEKYKNSFKSVDDISAELKENGIKIGKTTVYRTLERFTEDGTVIKIPSINGAAAKYSYMGEENSPQHAKLICLECGKISNLKCKSLEEFSNHILKEHDFSLDKQHAVLYGHCSKCRKE